MEKLDLHRIVTEFLKYDVSSESEVRSKLIDHLIVFLGYPPELRAEEFPVYGYNDNKQQRAKPADYITFRSNDYVKHKGKKSQSSLEWVRNNSLLVFEAKNKDEMPKNLNQPAYYATWTRAVAYLVCDGKRIKGYYYKDCTSDREIIDCKVEELPQMDSFDYFSYENILSLKERRLSENTNSEVVIKIRDYYESEESEYNVQVIDSDKDLDLPEETINYMRKSLGRNSTGLSNLQVTSRFLNMTNCFLQNRIRYDIPEYMLVIPREKNEVLIYINDNLIYPLFGANTIHYYRNEIDIYNIYNDFANVIIHMTSGIIDDVSMGFKIYDSTVDERLAKFSKIQTLLESHLVSVYTKNDSSTKFSFSPNIDKNLDRLVVKTKIDLKSLEFLKAIEEFYEIEFTLSIVNSEKVMGLLENIATVYNGIVHEQNHILNYPQEAFAELSEGITNIESPVSFPESDGEMHKTNLQTISLFNYTFTPGTITLLPCSINICHESNKKIAIPCCCTYDIKS